MRRWLLLLVFVPLVAGQPPDDPCVPPQAKMQVEGTGSHFVGEPVTFHDVSTPSHEVVRREWDLGDGTNATAATVQHTYPQGKFTIELQVWGECDWPSLHVERISVVPRPQMVDVREPPPVQDVPAPLGLLALAFLGLLQRR